MPNPYNEFIHALAGAFENALSEIAAGHNFDLGPEFEIAICKILKRVLPQRLGVCRGYVVNGAGEMAGDDILIYDQVRFPTARLLKDDLSQKEQVPVEAVYAYIEAKHGLALEGADSDATLSRALSQTAKVRRVCETRAVVPLSEIAQAVSLDPTLTVTPAPGWPPIRNPMYTAVFIRHVLDKPKGSHITDPSAIHARLASLSNPVHTNFVAVGANNILLPYVPSTGNVRPFIVGEEYAYLPARVDGTAFAFALCHLLWALDYVFLGKMPWDKILDAVLKKLVET